MKMYALFDTSRNKYFRVVFDERVPFTAKPFEMTASKSRLAKRASLYNKKTNWERFGYKGPVPKLKVVEFEVDTRR